VTGPVAIVSGGASGIGAATAARLAADGYRVVVADRQVDLGKEHAEAIGGRFAELDVRHSADWDRVVAEVLATEGGLDVAHLNAGVTTRQPDLLALTDEAYDRVVDVNVRGVVAGALAAARAMADRGTGGALVVTASLAGILAFAPDPMYTLTKHAVVGFVRAAAPQLEARGITINAVCPAVVDTPLLGDEGRARMAEAGIPIMPASDIADAVVTAIGSGRTGECWTCWPGRPPQVHEFRDPRPGG
jgi:NAD(P)-dependent dehydrogenase (short-subunit alcohol dehydrogenase family)